MLASRIFVQPRNQKRNTDRGGIVNCQMNNNNKKTMFAKAPSHKQNPPPGNAVIILTSDPRRPTIVIQYARNRNTRKVPK
jgi:hypothetical protein